MQVAATQQERRRRQRQARRGREKQQKADAAALRLAAQSRPVAAAEQPAREVHCPLWSTTVGQQAAFVRLLAEVTQRCAHAAQAGALATAEVTAAYGGSAHAVTVLAGTVATKMDERSRSAALLALLDNGLSEEALQAFLTQWSVQAAAQGSATLSRGGHAAGAAAAGSLMQLSGAAAGAAATRPTMSGPLTSPFTPAAAGTQMAPPRMGPSDPFGRR